MEAKLKRVNGILKVDIDGRIYEPVSFKSFRPTDENISQFYESGVRLFSILSSGINCTYGIPYSLFGESWLGVGKYDLSVIDAQIDLFIKNAPDAYFGLMILLDTRDWWLEAHKDYPNSFGYISQMAYDTEWREAAANYLKTVLSHVEEKYGDRMYGYYILGGKSTEWLSDYDYQESHPIKERYFRDYLGDENARIPEKERLSLSPERSFYDDKEVSTYHKAHAELISDTILYFAGEAQKILKHKKLFGLYYGYVLELTGERLWNAGHMDYERVFRSPDIDIISSPASYEFRAPESTSAFMVAHRTLDMNDKLYFFEFDQRTYLSQNRFEGIEIPPAGYHCKDDRETVDLMRRDFMLCAANGAALWWFDMWNGWYSSPKMKEGIANMVKASERLSAIPQESASEIAVFVSGKALYGVNKTSEINTLLYDRQRGGLSKLGAPYDLYSTSDLPQINTRKYKLFVFLGAFELSEEERSSIEKIKAEGGKTLLWCYAPAYLNGGLPAVEKITDMKLSALSEQPTYDANDGTPFPFPYICSADESAVIIARFSDGKPAVSYKRVNGNISVLSSLGDMSADLLRKIAKIAGVHIYSEDAAVYVNSAIIGVYTRNPVHISIKSDGTYEDIFSGKRYVSKDKKLFIDPADSASKLLVLTDK